ncbi:MAG TPA: hypothetical protein GX403_09255 [Rhodocyclaceae bacterium]|nr:hypothetical protein [Rhodocyclaceae bacterium]
MGQILKVAMDSMQGFGTGRYAARAQVFQGGGRNVSARRSRRDAAECCIATSTPEF